jgi:hypothetical protein
MSDHGDVAEPMTDITDFYVFAKPGDPSHTILVLDVNPDAPKRAVAFDPRASYEFKIDTNADLYAEVAYHVLFQDAGDGQQTAALYRVSGMEAEGSGAVGEAIIQDAPVCFDERVVISGGKGHRMYAGLRSDPFFFDWDGYINHFQWTGQNVNENSNVFSIVLEVPNSEFGASPVIHGWVRTMASIHGEQHQVDQAGRPGTSPFFFHTDEEKAAFNGSHPSRQVERFLGKVMSEIQERFGFSVDEARGQALQWLPDLLPFEPGCSDGFPNGRQLNDDTIGMGALVWTRGKCGPNPLKGNENLLEEFPYLGNPHGF